VACKVSKEFFEARKQMKIQAKLVLALCLIALASSISGCGPGMMGGPMMGGPFGGLGFGMGPPMMDPYMGAPLMGGPFMGGGFMGGPMGMF
jgi:hypothetical protein